jgi:hypothetical protein
MRASLIRTVPTPRVLALRVLNLLLCWYEGMRIRAAEKDLAGFKFDREQLQADLDALPLKEAGTRAWIEQRRVRLASLERGTP